MDVQGGWVDACLCHPRWYLSGMDQAILEREALRLPAHERALLADALLGSLDDAATHENEIAWAEEAEKRLEAYRRGEVKTIEGASALTELRARFKK
jgi:putative addiction module component (TIGR02574 family)